MSGRTSKKSTSCKPVGRPRLIRKVHREESQELKFVEAETAIVLPELECEREDPCGGMVEVELWPRVRMSLWEQLLS
jgi:hypothetical protein